MADSTLIFTTFLPSAWYKFALYMTEHVERCAETPTILLHDGRLDDFASGDADAAFIDILSYSRLLEQHPCPVELVAVPAMQDGDEDALFASFFDVVVRRESNFHVPDDLEGCVWAYHGETAHVEDDFLYWQDAPGLHFSQAIETSSPAQALRYVLDGKADAASIDARVLDLALRNSPHMAARLRILGRGCHTVHPLIVVASRLAASLKQEIRDAFLTVHREPFFTPWLSEQGIERFNAAENSSSQGQSIPQWYEHVLREPIFPLAKERVGGGAGSALAQRFISAR